jgi:hypothetical protein
LVLSSETHDGVLVDIAEFSEVEKHSKLC